MNELRKLEKEIDKVEFRPKNAFEYSKRMQSETKIEK
jgi:hypothetical protein